MGRAVQSIFWRAVGFFIVLEAMLVPAGHPLRDVKRAECVPEPRVLRAGIHEPREPHLLDPA